MKNASTALKKYIKNGGAFYAYAVVTLSTGEKLVLTSEKDFMCNGNSYSEQGGSNGFPLGEALSKTITITIDNMDERFSKYDFYYSRIAMYTEVDIEYTPWKDASGNDIGDINGNPIYILEPSLERIPEGVFTVLNPVSVGDIIELTAYDDMWKTDKAYNPGIPFPATARQVLVDVCGSCGVTVGSATFPNEDFQIINSPENLTCRQAVGYIAQIACGNAVVQNGSLYIKTYDFGAFSGITDETAPEKLSETAGYHILSEFKEDPDIDTDNVIITGISTVRGEGNEEETVLYGKDTYCLKINNPLIKDVEEKAVAYLGKKLCGTVLRKFSGSFFADPTVEFMDLACVVDRKNKVYRTLITSHEFEYLGGSRYSCDINSPVRQAGEYYSNATAIYQAQKETKKNKKEWEKAVENMNEALENASGMFPTEVPQPDGSSIVYIHDKKTLEESKNVFKITSAAVGFSTDGGKTYPFGFMLTGEFIAKILYTIGINADYINTGAITVKDSDGNIIFQADIANKRVIISGDYVQIGGKTVPEKLNEVLSESKTYSDRKLSESLKTVEKDLKTQIDEKIDTFSQSSDPSVDWDTTEKKTAHTGDIWYDESEKLTKRWSGKAWGVLHDKEAEDAKKLAETKRRIFATTPVPPYDVNDLWSQGSDGDMMICKVAKSSGEQYAESDWGKATKYTDDSAVDNLNETLNFEEIFRRLTNDGAVKGIYKEGNQLYISFTYAKGGELTLGGVGDGNGTLNIYNDSNFRIGRWSKDGIVISGGSFKTGNNEISNKNVELESPKIFNRLYMKLYKDDTYIPVLIPKPKGTDANDIINVDFGSATAGERINRMRLQANRFELTTYSGDDPAIEISGKARMGDVSVSGLRMGSANCTGKITTYQLETSGYKNRYVETENYGERLLFSYETSSPMFGDVGSAVIDEDGMCYIDIEQMFSETANIDIDYYVFLQKEGSGDIWVEEKEENYFVVRGTPKLKFSWELKAKQREFETERMEIREIPMVEEIDYLKETARIAEDVDYESQGYQVYFDYIKNNEEEVQL